MSGMKILCVENRPEDMAVLAYMLKGIGYEVMPAVNGDEAVKQAIDGVLLEYNLPDATGAAVREQLKAIRPDYSCALVCRCGHPNAIYASLLRCIFAGPPEIRRRPDGGRIATTKP
jgi:CheY-like chemotaxis protein